MEDYLATAPDTLVEKEETAVAESAEVKYDKKEGNIVKTVVISSPVNGMAAELSTAPDEAFARKMMEDGEVAFVFDTKHAIGFLTDSGISLLIHIGI